MSRHRPWYPWYPTDYANDTKFLTDSADLLYRRILDLLWMCNGMCPKNVQKIAKNVHFSRQKFYRAWPEIEHYFYTENGHIRHKRIDSILSEVVEISEKRAGAARKRHDASAPASAPAIAENNIDANASLLTLTLTQDPNNNTDKSLTIATGTGKQSKIDRCPYGQIFDVYREILVPPLPDIVKPDAKTRRGYIRARWREDLPTLEQWRNFFTWVSQSDFLCGRTKSTNGRPPFVADLEWICRPQNFIKITQSNYHR